MTWKIPKAVMADIIQTRVKEQEHPDSLSRNILDYVCKEKCKSTYQKDFLGLPQGKFMWQYYTDVCTGGSELMNFRGCIVFVCYFKYLGKKADIVTELDNAVIKNWTKQLPKYSLDSTARSCFQTSSVPLPLVGNTTRYGCNNLKPFPALGIGAHQKVTRLAEKSNKNYNFWCVYGNRQASPIMGVKFLKCF